MKTKSGSVQHWLHGKKEYKVLISEETKCSECIHIHVCDQKFRIRCSNYEFGTSGWDDGCSECVNRHTRTDEKQPIPCFHCKYFVKIEKTYTRKELVQNLG